MFDFDTLRDSLQGMDDQGITQLAQGIKRMWPKHLINQLRAELDQEGYSLSDYTPQEPMSLQAVH